MKLNEVMSTAKDKIVNQIKDIERQMADLEAEGEEYSYAWDVLDAELELLYLELQETK